ncbi:DNA-binding protein [Enterococcus sp. CWB-B31]|uniref:DNA-binding protein n=1 Tax=Enterococcus sp. CWB-B31 TaxID=2885159 RepID=UPI001E61BFA5|nr:DNA-binding protein [Enterococcus sp. CWB-B31]MCB5953982.1 DNA-binding protein [Enterococcus sp. CWB-B31]
MANINVLLSEEQAEDFRKEIYSLVLESAEKARRDASLDKDFLNQFEAASYLGVSQNTLKDYSNRFGLPVTVMGSRKFYSKTAIREFMLSKQKKIAN